MYINFYTIIAKFLNLSQLFSLKSTGSLDLIKLCLIFLLISQFRSKNIKNYK
jgi:hypothetical protein